MSYEFIVADVFTGQAFGGNQLAVVIDAVGLSDERMQSIAREFNFSETTFVLPPTTARGQADASVSLSITQDVRMGRPSQLEASAIKAGGQVRSVSAGGHTVIVARGHPDATIF